MNEGIPGVMDWKESVPITIMNWAKREANNYTNSGAFNVFEFFDYLVKGEESWASYKRINNIKVHTCPAKWLGNA